MRIAVVATPQARPYGIVATPSGDAWAVLFGVAKLAHVARADLAVREVDLPRPLARPRRLGLEASGAVWYVDFAQGFVGRHDPATGATREWPAPSKPSAPYAMAMDSKGQPWLFETAPRPNLLWRVDVATGSFVDKTPVPGGGGVVRHMTFEPRCHCLWFGTDRNTLGRADLPK
jgi:virginiamycin B lyase